MQTSCAAPGASRIPHCPTDGSKTSEDGISHPRFRSNPCRDGQRPTTSGISLSTVPNRPRLLDFLASVGPASALALLLWIAVAVDHFLPPRHGAGYLPGPAVLRRRAALLDRAIKARGRLRSTIQIAAPVPNAHTFRRWAKTRGRQVALRSRRKVRERRDQSSASSNAQAEGHAQISSPSATPRSAGKSLSS